MTYSCPFMFLSFRYWIASAAIIVSSRKNRPEVDTSGSESSCARFVYCFTRRVSAFWCIACRLDSPDQLEYQSKTITVTNERCYAPN